MKKEWLTSILIIFIIFLSLQIYKEVEIIKNSTSNESFKTDELPVVVSKIIPATDTIQDISKTSKAQLALRDKLLALLDAKDSDSVYKIVDAIQADKNISQNCHDIAHDIGHEAYEMYGFSGAINFSKSDPNVHRSVQDICAGGYIHGVLEEAALHKPDFKLNPGAMCEDVNVENSDNCYHGVGHALMFSYWRDVNQSLEGCRSTGYISHHTRCFEGVWMELFWGNPDATSTEDLGWDTMNPLQACKETQNDAKPACYLYSVLGYLRMHKNDYQGVVNLCIKSDLNDSDSHFCIKGLGLMMVRNLREENPSKIESYAVSLNTNQKIGYYKGLLGYADLAGVSKEKMSSLCNSLKRDGNICNQVLLDFK